MARMLGNGEVIVTSNGGGVMAGSTGVVMTRTTEVAALAGIPPIGATFSLEFMAAPPSNVKTSFEFSLDRSVLLVAATRLRPLTWEVSGRRQPIEESLKGGQGRAEAGRRSDDLEVHATATPGCPTVYCRAVNLASRPVPRAMLGGLGES
jgi:hypothetical protein